MDSGYCHVNTGQAGTDEISIELFSETKLYADTKASLSGHLTSKLPKAHDNRVLIIGGKVGITTMLLLPYSSRIDLVVQAQYLPVLQALTKNQNVNFTFYREGLLGDKYTIPGLQGDKCKINIIQISQFHSAVTNQNSYDVVLLQNIIVHPQINIVHELMRLDHQVLITMIVPGKIIHQGLFELLSGLQENILHIFYEQETHERLEYIRYLTGKWQEINIWEIFVWKKKDKTVDSCVEVKEISAILDEEMLKNKIGQKIQKVKYYESPEALAEYMDFDYGEKGYFGIKKFPLQMAELIIKESNKLGFEGRALDVGCALGRSTLELAYHFKQVVGVDSSKTLIEHASKIVTEKYQQVRDKVKFELGDACKLDPALGKFDVIYAGNLLDKLSDPEVFLASLPNFLNEKGMVVLSSPYLWRQKYTAVEKWIGGRQIDGKQVNSYMALRVLMEKLGLKEVRQSEDIRFAHKENPWVFSYVSCHVTYWGR